MVAPGSAPGSAAALGGQYVTGRLFPVPDVARPARGCTDLVPFGLNCPHGHGPLVPYQECQPALFVHGGYGAARQTTWHQCPLWECRFSVTTEIIEINPRSLR